MAGVIIIHEAKHTVERTEERPSAARTSVRDPRSCRRRLYNLYRSNLDARRENQRLHPKQNTVVDGESDSRSCSIRCMGGWRRKPSKSAATCSQQAIRVKASERTYLNAPTLSSGSRCHSFAMRWLSQLALTQRWAACFTSTQMPLCVVHTTPYR